MNSRSSSAKKKVVAQKNLHGRNASTSTASLKSMPENKTSGNININFKPPLVGKKNSQPTLSQNKNGLFRRFYDKFSHNVEDYLNEKNENEPESDNCVELIGNQRFNHSSVQIFLDEKHNGKIYNEFNPKFEEDLEKLKELNNDANKLKNESFHKSREDSKEAIAARRSYQNKKIEMLNKIELTPLPIKKKHGDDKDKVIKAERTAVIMRRFEYEMNLHKRKSVIGPSSNSSPDKKKNTLEIGRKIISEEKSAEAKRNSFDKESFTKINDKVIRIQKVWREYKLHITRKEYLLIGKVRMIQRNYKMHLPNRKDENHTFINSLMIQSENFEVIRNQFVFHNARYLNPMESGANSVIIQSNNFNSKLLITSTNSLVNYKSFEVNKYNTNKLKQSVNVNFNYISGHATVKDDNQNKDTIILLASHDNDKIHFKQILRPEIFRKEIISGQIKHLNIVKTSFHLDYKIETNIHMEFSKDIDRINNNIDNISSTPISPIDTVISSKFLKPEILRFQKWSMFTKITKTYKNTIQYRIVSVVKIQRKFRKYRFKSSNVNKVINPVLKEKKILSSPLVLTKKIVSMKDIIKIMLIQRKIKEKLGNINKRGKRLNDVLPVVIRKIKPYNTTIFRRIFPIFTIIALQNKIKKFLKKLKTKKFQNTLKKHFLHVPKRNVRNSFSNWIKNLFTKKVIIMMANYIMFRFI
jgi:hypothetical protein